VAWKKIVRHPVGTPKKTKKHCYDSCYLLCTARTGLGTHSTNLIATVVVVAAAVAVAAADAERLLGSARHTARCGKVTTDVAGVGAL
jgi:hypothetical protein